MADAKTMQGRSNEAGGAEPKPQHPELRDSQSEETAVEEPEEVSEKTGESRETTQRIPLEKKVSKASVNNVASIPNGGLKAWLQVAGSFCLSFNTWGVLNTYGAYQTYYEGGQLFVESSSTLSWIGALQSCLLLLVGVMTGPVYDAGHFNLLIYSGAFFVVFGQMMLSLCHTYWQALLAQAVCIGLGAGLLYVPSVAILSTYFNKRIALVVGIAASGSSLGGVIYPIVFHRLQPTIGFAWTTRVIGFIMLATFSVPLAVMRVRVLPASKRALWDWTALKDIPYVVFVFGVSLGFMGLYVPFFYIQYFSEYKHLTSPGLSFYLLAILNAASIFGRIVPNFIADKAGALNMQMMCALAASVLIFGLTGVHNEAGVVIIALLYGFFSGTFVSLTPSVFVSLTPNRGMIGTRMGMGFTVTSFFVLTGTPIAGAILGPTGSTNLNWTGIWAFGGATTGAGAFIMVASRFIKTGPHLMVKA